jgi:hypothetical protein
MIAVIAPEPVSWLGRVLDELGELAPVHVLAPWAMPAAWWRLEHARALPARVQSFGRRRAIPGARNAAITPTTIPGWFAAEAGLRAWAGERADRTLRARFLVRRAVDALAARWLATLRPAPRAVIAASCAAERTLAAAERLGATGILLEDVPAIRELHCDLDAAWRAHPQCAFLRRYRAPAAIMVRQEVERVLASYVIVRGHHARAARQAAGMAADRIIDLVEAAPAAADMHGSAPAPARARAPGRVLLAGLAAARHGTMEALAAIADRPHITLLVRAGEGLEPPDLLAHPRVNQASAEELAHLRDVDAVIAPSWTEAYLGEVRAAAAAGVPVVATLRGAGLVTPARVIAPGDAAALGRALDEVLGATSAQLAQPAQRGPALGQMLGRILAPGLTPP